MKAKGYGEIRSSISVEVLRSKPEKKYLPEMPETSYNSNIFAKKQLLPERMAELLFSCKLQTRK